MKTEGRPGTTGVPGKECNMVRGKTGEKVHGYRGWTENNGGLKKKKTGARKWVLLPKKKRPNLQEQRKKKGDGKKGGRKKHEGKSHAPTQKRGASTSEKRTHQGGKTK